VSLSTGNSQEELDRLADYSADVGVLTQVARDERFVSVPYSEYAVTVFCSGNHRFAQRRSTPWLSCKVSEVGSVGSGVRARS
jgi:DNA-binding transcriptional LysR family regulator